MKQLLKLLVLVPLIALSACSDDDGNGQGAVNPFGNIGGGGQQGGGNVIGGGPVGGAVVACDMSDNFGQCFQMPAQAGVSAQQMCQGGTVVAACPIKQGYMGKCVLGGGQMIVFYYDDGWMTADQLKDQCAQGGGVFGK